MLALTAAGGLLASLAFATSAQADDFGLDRPNVSVAGVGAIPDDFNHTYCFSGAWTTAWTSLVAAQMQNLDNQTSYWDTRVFLSCETLAAIGAVPNVRFELSTTMSARGAYRCWTWNRGDDGKANTTGDERCVMAVIRINSAAGVLTSDHQRRKTICHEIGHSVGLAHGNQGSRYYDDCMVSGAVADGVQWEQYNQHHRDHANSRRPSRTVPVNP